MARVPYVEANDESLTSLYSDIAGLRGRVLNLHKVLANQPEALRAFMVTSRYVRDDAELAGNLRELAVLATAHAVGSAYEQHHHIAAGRKAGVREEQLAAFPSWSTAPVFDDLERAVMLYADQVTRTRDVDDATFATLQAQLTPGALLDLVFTVGWYHLCAAILGPLRVEIEDDAPRPRA